MTPGTLLFTGLTLLLLVLPTASHAQTEPDVTLYEVSERVTFSPDDSIPGGHLRHATAPLLGSARLGTPLCPSELVAIPRIGRCTVIATGWDRVSTVTGQGPVHGRFDVVVNAPGDSSRHVPNLPVMSGTFAGTVDLSD